MKTAPGASSQVKVDRPITADDGDALPETRSGEPALADPEPRRRVADQVLVSLPEQPLAQVPLAANSLATNSLATNSLAASSLATNYVSTIVPTMFVAVLVLVGARLILPEHPENGDRLAGLVIAFSALLLIVKRIAARLSSPSDHGSLRPASPVIVGTGLGVMVLAAATVTRIQGRTDLWSGFGLIVTGIALGIATALWLNFDRLRNWVAPLAARRRTSWLSRAIGACVALYYLPSAIQTRYSLQSSYDAMYSVHETLAPLAGRTPMGNSVSQYSYLAGWPLLALRSLVTADPMGSAIVYLSALALLTLSLLCWVVSRSLPKPWRGLAPVLVLPLVLVKQPANHLPGGSITTLFSALPMRTLLPMILISTLVIMGRPLFEGSVPAGVIVGLLGGLSALNNPEFGVPTLFAGLATICVLTNRPVRIVAAALVATPLPFVGYAVLANSRGTSIDFNSYTLFIRSFGGGFGREPMPIFGLWVLVFGMLVAGLSTGLRASRALLSRAEFDRRSWDPAATAIFFGLLGALTVFYYTGRSVVSGQLQVFLLFLAPSVVSTLAICLSQDGSLPERDALSGDAPRSELSHEGAMSLGVRFRANGARLLLWFPIGLTVASLALAPDAGYELSRNRQSSVVSVMPNEADVVERMKASPPNALYFGPLGHVVSLKSGRRSAMLFNHPMDDTISAPTSAAACAYIATFGDVPIYVERSSLAEFATCPTPKTPITLVP